MMTLLWTKLIYLKGLMSVLEFSANMVYVWCKQMLKDAKKHYIEVKLIFENFSENLKTILWRQTRGGSLEF